MVEENKCKECGHKIVVYATKDGESFWKHIWENELGYCQAKNCGCNKPEPESRESRLKEMYGLSANPFKTNTEAKNFSKDYNKITIKDDLKMGMYAFSLREPEQTTMKLDLRQITPICLWCNIQED